MLRSGLSRHNCISRFYLYYGVCMRVCSPRDDRLDPAVRGVLFRTNAPLLPSPLTTKPDKLSRHLSIITNVVSKSQVLPRIQFKDDREEQDTRYGGRCVKGKVQGEQRGYHGADACASGQSRHLFVQLCFYAGPLVSGRLFVHKKERISTTAFSLNHINTNAFPSRPQSRSTPP